MSCSYLVFLRHGQSTWNLENKFTGWRDVPLTSLGEEEAKQAGKKLQSMIFDYIFVSPLQRALKTAQLVLETLHQTSCLTLIDVLKERDYGQLTGLNKQQTIDQYGKEQVHLWRRGFAIQPPGGESLKDVVARIRPFYETVLSQELIAQKNILIVAHGNSLRALLYILDEYSEEEIPSVELQTAVPLVFEFEHGIKKKLYSIN